MTAHDATEAKAKLFDMLDDLRAGMLGIEGSHEHMRPMTHYVVEDEAAIHFLTSRQTDLAREVGQGATAHYCVVDDDDGFYACITGTLAPNQNEALIDEIWNPVAAAWFTGRDDPDLLLLSLPMREAEVWTSTDSTLHFGIEIVRANLNPDHVPHIGKREVVRF